MNDKLKTYRVKRDFSRTAEPSGATPPPVGHSHYVMHKHAASHDHFDLRLEQGGVLRSWALPKGPSLKPGEKRLAVEVEDHPLEYGQFEGVIPHGQYGGGTVMLWDLGRWKPRGKPKADRLDFDLEGEKLSGHWTLVRMNDKQPPGRRSGKNWLLIKRSDEAASKVDDCSAVSGRTMEQIAREETPSAASEKVLPDPGALTGARKAPLPDRPAVQLATLVDAPPEGENWIHELKFDGYRVVAKISQQQVSLLTRNGKDWSRRFAEIARALKKLQARQAILDGEVVAPQADGSTSFRKLQEALSKNGRKAAKAKLVYQVFDLLHLDDQNLEKVPLLERKSALKQLLNASDELGEVIRYSDHVRGEGIQFHSQVCEMGLEGTVSKEIEASYRPGRQRTWLKSKCTHQDEFVVGGLTPPSGARQGFGALLLGAYDGDKLIYAGRVGAGFSAAQLNHLHRQLKSLQRKTSPFSTETPYTRGIQWVKPEIVVDVEFTERTRSGVLRHPVFRGVREDKLASEVQMRTDAKAPPDPPTEKSARPASGSKGPGSSERHATNPVVAGVPITHPDRILYPEHGITKLDVARYYEDVEAHIMPHLRHRPLSLLRCPEGLEQDCFFQKHPDKQFAKDVPRTPISEKRGGTSSYLYVSSISELVWLVQYGVLEFHPWGCQISDVEKPDTLIFDLDPGPRLAGDQRSGNWLAGTA